MGLESFAADEIASRVRPNQCVTCALPPEVLAEITAARSRNPRRFTYPIITKYLNTDHQVEVTVSSVKRHFATHV